MVNVYEFKGEFVSDYPEFRVPDKWVGSWQLVSEKIVPFFENPLKQGEYYLHKGNKPIEEIPERDTYEIGAKHIASNFGLTKLGFGTTHILSPDKTEGFILLQKSDKDIIKISGKAARYDADIDPNPLKLADGGNTYLVYGSFEDIINEIVSSGYNILERKGGESLIDFHIRMREIFRRRTKNITQDFVDKINEEISGIRKYTREELVEHFTGSDL